MCRECGLPIRRHGYVGLCRADRSQKKHRRGQAVACLHWYSMPANSMSGLLLMPTTVDGGSTRHDRSGMPAPRERAGMRRMRSAPMPTGPRGCWETGPSWLSSDTPIHWCMTHSWSLFFQYRSLTQDVPVSLASMSHLRVSLDEFLRIFVSSHILYLDLVTRTASTTTRPWRPPRSTSSWICSAPPSASSWPR